MKTSFNRITGFSLVELLAVVSILAVLATYIIPRVTGNSDSAKANACHTQQGDIELQTQLWWRNTGSYPTANLSDISANPSYFPEGVPTCPVDGSTYTIDTTSGLVTGHDH